MEILIHPDSETASCRAARLIAARIRAKPGAVLGLATGQTPLAVYRELVRMHREEDLDFSNVTTFNLDEYLGLSNTHPASYHRYMKENFFRWVNLKPGNGHLPDGLTRDVAGHSAEYETAIRDAGGIDLQILGIGTDGHIGFNEPGSSLASRTRIKTLTRQTLKDNAAFFEKQEEMPHHVITMGIGTILESREAVFLAFGERKAAAVAKMVEGPVTALVPASSMQLHANVKVFIDEPAASRLERAEYYRWVLDNKPDWQRV